MLTWALPALFAALVAGGAALPPPGPLAVVHVPDEPGAIVLPDGTPTLQAVAADLDADGDPELVRLVAGDNGTVWIEAWVQGGEGWVLMAAPALAVPGQAGQGEAAYARRPVRLLVRQIGGRDRVTIVRQPLFSGPEDERECCLLIDDLVVDRNTLRLENVDDPSLAAGRSLVADAVHVIDLDGDGTDELLASYFLAPLNDASSLTEARVFRWAGDHFALLTTGKLPVGSGSSPYVLGDTDGVAGDEAAFISSSALNVLFRIRLDHNRLITEDSGLIVDDALAVPLSTSRGLAVLAPRFGLAILSWPPGGQPSVPIAAQPVHSARLLGVVDIGGAPRLLVHRTDPDELEIRALPDLTPTLPRGPIAPSQSAATLGRGPLFPYVGPLPGGGPHGAFSAIVAGSFIPAQVLDDPAAPIGALAAARPIGLVGRDRAWLAIQQGAIGLPPLDPTGGRLDPPAIEPASAVAIVPIDEATRPEGNGGAYDPPIQGGVALADGVIGVNRDGLVADVVAPPGSRVYLPGRDEPERPEVLVVGDDGALDVRIEVPAGVTADADGAATMTVVTPAGHAYTSSWDLRLVDGPPDLRATAETMLGSSRVIVAGRAPPYAEVEVAGRAVAVDEQGRFSTGVDLPPWPTAVTVSARDPIGHEASLIVSGIGILDYRGLPWLPIALVLLGGAAVALILRVPKPRTAPRSIGDDAVLEEIDPADSP